MFHALVNELVVVMRRVVNGPPPEVSETFNRVLACIDGGSKAPAICRKCGAPLFPGIWECPNWLLHDEGDDPGHLKQQGAGTTSSLKDHDRTAGCTCCPIHGKPCTS
jgi:hypothetical protein